MTRLLRRLSAWLAARDRRHVATRWIDPPPSLYLPQTWIDRYAERSTR